MSNEELARTVVRLFAGSGKGNNVHIPVDVRAEMNEAATLLMCDGCERDDYYRALTNEWKRLRVPAPRLSLLLRDGPPFNKVFFEDGVPAISDCDIIRLLVYELRVELFAEVLSDSYACSVGRFWREAVTRFTDQILSRCRGASPDLPKEKLSGGA